MSPAAKAAVGRVRRLPKDRAGSIAVFAALAAPVLVGFAGLGIDVGYMETVKSQLQASANAAALAGATAIRNNSTSAQVTASAATYAAASGGKNVIPGVTATMSSTLKCFTSINAPCTNNSSANGIVVQQQATVPTFFARVFGINSFNVAATGTAGASAGKRLNVMLVVDTTASMKNQDSNCSNNSKIVCALGGVRTILSALSPTLDQVGLMVFPGLTNSTQAQYDYACHSSTQPQTATYGGSPAPVYQVIPLSTDYRTSDSATSLNSSSHLVIAAGGVSSCSPGLQAPGGKGTYYADAITAAQAALPNVSGTQNVIILLSDGDASASAPSQIVSSKSTNQCHAGITAATTATAAGTWVYAIAYGASTSGGCSTDKSPAITPCDAMKAIASDTSKFFTDSSSSACQGQNPSTNLAGAFTGVTTSLLQPRLLPNGTS